MYRLRLTKIIVIMLVCCVSYVSYADSYPLVIESDTSQVLNMLQEKALKQQIAKQPLGDIIQWSALQLVGQPYVGHLLDESTPEYLYISLTATDCMLFVEEVTAVGELLHQHDLNLDNLAKNIKNLRYHGDVGYCNRNHYFKDWALSNITSGTMIDEGYTLTHMIFPYSVHVLSDSIKHNTSSPHQIDLSCIKQREKIIDRKQLGFIPLKDLPKYLNKIRNGDIVGIVRTPNAHEDAVHHLGIAYIHDDQVGMIHASSTSREVVISQSLVTYLNKFKDSQGIILLRAKN